MFQNEFYFLDEVLGFGMPVNQRGYIEDELLTPIQFIEEYGIFSLSFFEEIKAGRLSVLKKGEKILIARSDAKRWHDTWCVIWDSLCGANNHPSECSHPKKAKNGKGAANGKTK